MTIDWCNDIKSYKKLIPTLKKYAESIIVTADDDILYKKNWLEQLYKAYCKNPNHIHCHRAHFITFHNKKLLPYEKWKYEISKCKPAFNNFFTGVGGVLYPPSCFYKDILREDLFMQLCPQADDIWFWAMCILNNKKINVVTGKQELKYVDETQKTALWLSNVKEGKNNVQFQNVIKHYPQIMKKLDKNNGLYHNNFEKIFSLKNEGVRKVVTIFGLKLKLKSKKLEDKEKIKNLERKIEILQKRTKQQLLLPEQTETLEKISEKIEDFDNLYIEFENYKKNINTKFDNIYNWQTDFYKDIPNSFQAALTDDERDTICKYLKETKNYLEFGAGGSTFLVLKLSDANIYSVDSDEKWLDYLRSYKFIREAEKNEKLKFFHKFIGQTTLWGYPADDDYMENFPNYSSEIFSQIDTNSIDTVLIDGRFRVACTIQTILNCPNIKYILFHDYVNRKHYHIVENFLDRVETVDTLAVFKVKEDTDREQLKNIYSEYKYTKK